MSHLRLVVVIVIAFISPDAASAQSDSHKGTSAGDSRGAFPLSDPLIEPDRLLVKPGRPLSVRALVTTPGFIKGVVSWSLETTQHRGTFSVTALSPDGKLLATGGLDGTIRLWESTTGKLVKALIGHDSYVYGLAFSPRGRYLASGGSFDGTARIWEVSTGQPVRVLKGHPSYVTQVAWTTDGRKLVGVGGVSGDVSVWEAASGLIRAKASLGHYIQSLAVHPDSARAAAVTTESAVLVIDLTTGKTQRNLGEAANKYFWLGWSPDGKQLAAGAAKATFVHDTDSGKVAATLEGAGHVVEWASDGTRLATASRNDATIRVWNPADFSLLHKVVAYATTLHFHAGKTQVIVSDTLGISIVNLADGKPVVRRDIAGTVPPFWTHNRPVLTGIGTSLLSLWDPSNGKLLHKLEGHTSSVTAFTWSPNGKALVSVGYDKTARVWDAETGTLRHTLTDHSEPILCVAWSPDGKEIATGGRDKKVLVWDAKTGALAQSLAGHRQEITCLAWTPNSATLAAGANDGNVFLYPRATWKQAKPLVAKPLTTPSALAWSPDGKTLAAGDSNGTVVLFAVPKGNVLVEFPTSGSPPYISSMVFYPNGSALASGRGNHTMDLWSLKTGKIIQTLPTMAPVQQVVWNASAPPLIAVSSADRTCRFFDPAAARLKGVLLAEPEQLVGISADGHYRGESPALDRLVYVVQTEKGQDTYTVADFAGKYAWKNNSAQARFASK
jgi:WD40 repeat protein